MLYDYANGMASNHQTLRALCSEQNLTKQIRILASSITAFIQSIDHYLGWILCNFEYLKLVQMHLIYRLFCMWCAP